MSPYLTPEACEERIRALGPKLAARYREDLRYATPITWQSNPALFRLACGYLYDPENETGLREKGVIEAIP
jgi:hypothetical protein